VPRTLSRAQALDVLTSQAAVAGYKAAVQAADAYGRYFPMMITASGTSRPAGVLVLGAGVAGLSAMGTARRLGAVVTGYDVRPQTRTEVESIGAKWLDLAAGDSGTAAPVAAGDGGYARALTDDERAAQQHMLEARVAAFDVVITTAAVPGARPPQLLSLAAVGRMRPGSVVVDTAAGPFGGNVEGSVEGATVTTEGGVVVIGASDLASRAPTAASDAFSSNIAALLSVLVVDGELADVAGGDEVLQAMVTMPPPSRAADKEDPNEPLTAV
jgi:NAD(P) transhydrogenase subunit alpha